MNSQMSLKFKSIGRCVGAMGTLIWTFAGMTTNVTLQLTQLDTCVVALWTLVWLFMSVSISDVAYQLTRCREGRFTELTEMWFGSRMCINVISEAGDSFEAAFAYITFVRSKINLS